MNWTCIKKYAFILLVPAWGLFYGCYSRSVCPAYGGGGGNGRAGAMGYIGLNLDGDILTGVPGDTTGETYQDITENPFLEATTYTVSTFSSDVDVASYGIIRSYIKSTGSLPPTDAVRIEEMINYFSYENEYLPEEGNPYSLTTEMADCPWRKGHKLARVTLTAKKISRDDQKAANLVFLVDVSGSMSEENKLPLVMKSLKFLVEELRPEDRVAIVTYSDSVSLALPSTTGDQKKAILEVIEKLYAHGSTAGGPALQKAYSTAMEYFNPDGINRIILCTDGDFNIGVSSDDEMKTMVEEKRNSGVSISCLGFGTGNLKDSKLEIIADHGNGNYAYVDGPAEARKQLVAQIGGTLETVAQDVKIQVGFNPSKVLAYRLIGYENRILAYEDFANDRKDAGDMGSGHTVTALYEIVPLGAGVSVPHVENEKKVTPLTPAADDAYTFEETDWMIVRSRYKDPGGVESKLIETTLSQAGGDISDASLNFRWATAVAGFGIILRQSPYAGDLDYPLVLDLANDAKGVDAEGYRSEFIEMIKTASAFKVTASKGK